MRSKNSVIKINPKLVYLTNDKLKESTSVCKNVVEELMCKIFNNLPPDPSILLEYSGILVRQTTVKLVNVNLLESQVVQSDQEDSEICLQIQQQNNEQAQLQPSQIKQSKWKNLSPQNSQFNQKSSLNRKQQKQINLPQEAFNKKQKSFRIREDEEIHLKKDGVKFVKRQQLKNLIKHRIFNSHSSLHVGDSNQATYNNFETKKSLHENENKKPMMRSGVESTKFQPNFISHAFIKSTKSFSALPGVNKVDLCEGNNSKKCISGVMNQTHFVNLKDFQKQKQHKQKQLKPFKRVSNLNQNHFGHEKNSPSNFSAYINQYIKNSQTAPWLHKADKQRFDEQDAIINKLRERKQKFYRTGLNYSNGDSHTNTKRDHNNTVIMNQQKGNAQNSQAGALMAFDYSGQIMPTVKYDMLKIQAHYQDMDFTIHQNDDSAGKKKQRKGYMFRGAINLKLVDHQRFIPHPNYKYEALVQKPGMLMQQNAGFMLKKGVELKGRDENTNNSANSNADQGEQTRQRIKKASFQFLYNQQIPANHIKYQEFIKYKKHSQSGSFNKSPSSRKKLFDLTNMGNNESLLSKKSIILKGMKNKNPLEDTNNKVHKSQNRRALQMLINNGGTMHKMDSHAEIFVGKNADKSDMVNSMKDNMTHQNGVLKKESHMHTHTKSLSNNMEKGHNQQGAIKKVRIA